MHKIYFYNLHATKHIYNITLNYNSILVLWLADLVLSDSKIHNLTPIEIEKLLEANRRSLIDFKPIPYPNGYVLQQLGNRLIYDKRNYDVRTMKSKFTKLFAALTGLSTTL